MTRPLDQKIALVTGASRGIGRATARALARDGAAVAVHYGRSRAEAEAVAAEIRAAGGRAEPIGADLADPAAIPALFEAFDRAFGGRLDILLNNAGIAEYQDFDATDAAALDRLHAVNMRAPFLVAQAGLRRMGEGGVVINLSSIVARTYFAGVLAYSATKGFVDVLTRHLAAEMGPRGIRVNAVAPGAIATDMSAWLNEAEGAANAHAMQALKRVGQPEDIADAIAALAGPGGRWITGEIVEVAGGSKL